MNARGPRTSDAKLRTLRTLRTRAFVDALAAGLLLFGLAARARLAAGSPLPSSQPVLWFSLAAAQDLAVIALAGALCLALARWGALEAAARTLFAAFAAVFGLLLVLWGEAVLYFGHAPRRQDLEVAAQESFVAFSLDRSLVARLVAVFAVLLVLVAGSVAWSRRARFAWSTPARLAAVGAGALALSLAPFRIHQAEAARNPAAVLISVAREARPLRKLSPAELSPRPDDVSVRGLVRADARYLDDAFPLAQQPAERSAGAPVLPEGSRPNIVFLVMEGVRAEEVGAYGGTVPNLTPNLDRLAREGVRIDGAYSPGTHTPEGEVALWYGLLALPGALVLTDAPDTRLTGLPELLRGSGWRDFLWIHNSDQTFFGEDRFFVPRGFRTIDGRDFDPRDARTSWGFSDRALARRALEAIDRLQPPFAAMMLTISNHHPFRLPPDAGPPVSIGVPEEKGYRRLPGIQSLVGRHTVPMLKTIHYTDEAVGDFFEGARARPWFSRTIFVVTSDHGLPIAALDGKMTMHRLEELRHRVPLLFYAPELLAPGTRPGPASLADVPPTLLGLLGIGSPRAGVGCDLLDPSGCDPARPVVTWNDEAHMVTLATGRFVYHRVVPSEGGADSSEASEDEDERLYAPVGDPLGERDLSSSEGEGEAAAEFRRLSDVYRNVYPRVVLGGRSGLPPSHDTRAQ